MIVNNTNFTCICIQDNKSIVISDFIVIIKVLYYTLKQRAYQVNHVVIEENLCAINDSTPGL